MADARASDARARANALFKAGDLPAAITNYEAGLLESPTPDANRLAILSNLGLCHMKLSAPERAAERLREGLRFHVVCYANPGLAAKTAGRLIQACDALEDAVGRRSALADCRFYLAVPGASAPGGLSLPPPPEPSEVVGLLSTIGSAQGDEGLAAVRAELDRVPGESLDENRIHALILCVHVSSMRDPIEWGEWGVALVRTCVDSGVPVDARSENGRTALMIAANSARQDLVQLFLERGADAAATDGDGFSALHAALADLADHELDALRSIVTALTAAAAPLDALNAKGMSPLMYCAQQGGENGIALAELLLSAGASTRVRSALHSGYSAFDFAVKEHGRDSPIATLLRHHAESYSREARLSCRQSDLTAAYRSFLEEKLLPAAASGDGGVDEGRARVLAEAAGIAPGALLRVGVGGDGVVSNPLETMWAALEKSLPKALMATRRGEAAMRLEEEEANELRLLVGGAAPGRAAGRVHIEPSPWMTMHRSRARGHAMPPEPTILSALLEKAVDGGEEDVAGRDGAGGDGTGGDGAAGGGRFVPRGAYAEYVALIQAPLQRVYSPAIPNDDALALLGLHAPLCELRARRGYWSALLRARGVECACYEDRPALLGGATFTDVVRGGVDDGSNLASTHSLLLVRPEWRDTAGAGPDGWDAAALRAYGDAGGKVVALVGALGGSGPRTASAAFGAALNELYERHLTAGMPQWPGGEEQVSIWRRREGVGAVGASGILEVRMELVDLEAPEWAAPERKGGPMMPSTSAFGKEGEKAFPL